MDDDNATCEAVSTEALSISSETTTRTPGLPTTLLVRAYRAAPPDSSHRLQLCMDALNSIWDLRDDLQSHCLQEALELGRDALRLMQPDHGDFAQLSMDVADLLVTNFEDTGEVILLDEAVALGQTALQVCVPDHPWRSTWCTSVAYWLSTRGEHTDNVDDFSNAVLLEEEALALVPSTHPERPTACGNLAVSIKHLFLYSGKVSLLDRIVALEREALELRPLGDTERGTSCLCLAQSLKMRHQHTADEAVLDEAIGLSREAIRLHPPDHSRRGQSCCCLSQCLLARIERTYEDRVALEAIELGREAVAWSSFADPNRDRYIMNLAALLTVRYDKIRELRLLDEAITLEREVQQRSPSNPPTSGYRVSCLNLASSYKKRYDHTGCVDWLVKALESNMEALACSQEENNRWRIAINLSDLYLCHGTALWDIGAAIARMHDACDWCLGNTPELLVCASKRLSRISVENLPFDQQAELLRLYTRVIHMMPLVAGFALDGASQLRAIDSCRSLGSEAFICAVENNLPHLGLELLELARGTLWSQALRLRDSQLADIPSRLSAEMTGLLRALSMEEPELGRGSRTLRDIRHEQNERVLQIIFEVRQLGYDRFMQGESFEVLAKSASFHPIVILVSSSRNMCHAVILHPPSGSLSHVHLGEIDIASLRVMVSAPTRGASVRLRRGIKFSDVEVPPHTAFARLWRKVVKPIILHLNISVSS
jgi:hypothetical protein